jgi:hypothetical protein
MAGIGCGVGRLIVVAIACAVPSLVRAAEPTVVAAPEPEVHVPLAASDAELESLAPGDPRRGAVLVRLALRRHADAAEAQLRERESRERGLAERRAGPEAGPSAGGPERSSRSSPRADALRAQAVGYALRVLEEAPDAPDLPDALIVAAIDAERIGRSREALRMLGVLLRRHAGSAQAADAWLALGEHHLRNADLTRARIAFDEAERRGRAAVRAWAAARNAELRAAVTRR